MGEGAENRQYSRFERADEFLGYLSDFLSLDFATEPTESQNETEDALLIKLSHILYEYQEQSNLMDPYLERMVFPTVDAFRSHARWSQEQRLSTPPQATYNHRVSRLVELIYRYIQVRGRKTIVRFFPHQVEDLSTALSCLSPSADPTIHETSEWTYRYVVLLWLSLITKIPFDLVRFDDDDDVLRAQKEAGTRKSEARTTTTAKLENLGKKYLEHAGMEGVGASLLLSGLYTRPDTSLLLSSFIASAAKTIEADADSFSTIGILRILNQVVKTSCRDYLAPYAESLNTMSSCIRKREDLMGNTLVRHLMTKFTCRHVLSCLPPRPQRTRVKAKVLVAPEPPQIVAPLLESDDIDVPVFVEDSLEDIFTYLQDRDTIVRYSAAKGISRISERLPRDFNDQVLENILSLFNIHTLPGEEEVVGGVGDGGIGVQLPASAESTWHGACLATAEFARRDLVSPERLPELLKWMAKALYFDVRKGAHSVGSSVRDAASYVLWSLARSQDAATMRPYALELARRLVAVSVYDREVQIRRAASAAFQENVGRLGVLPHGIDVLRKTDFYAVGVRKHAFLSAAVQVAEHSEYCSFLIDHLIRISIRHWDPAMRSVASQGLRAICELDLANLGSEVVQRVTPLLGSLDGNEVHGALLTLAELASAFASAQPALDNLRLETFMCLSKLPARVVKKYGNELILSAICLLTENSLSGNALAIPNSENWWRPALDASLKHRDDAVQESAAGAMAALSKLQPCSDYVKAASRDFARATPSAQQGFARTLGVLDYTAFPHGVETSTNVLVQAIDTKAAGYSKNVETRRNACYALTKIVTSNPLIVSQALGRERTQRIVQALGCALGDYTVDERGDVGSWVRIASVHGIGWISRALFEELQPTLLEQYFPSNSYFVAFAALLKQGSERLDTVRQEAGMQITNLLALHSTLLTNGALARWHPPGFELLSAAFLGVQGIKEFWSDGNALYPKMVTLLHVEIYRRPVLSGLILSIGSKNEATRRPASESVKTFLKTLPPSPTSNRTLSLALLCEDIFALAKETYSQNHLFTPILATLEIVLDEELSKSISTTQVGINILKRVLDLAGRNAEKIKSVPRVMACMKIVVATLSIEPLREQAVTFLRPFLDHRFPTVRVSTAEEIYVTLQTNDIIDEDESNVEDLLLETPWSTNGEYEEARDSVLRALGGENKSTS